MSASSFVPSNQWRHLRACLVCSVVQPYQKFVQIGCPNCEDFLDLINHPDAVGECTSQVFEGMITLTDPKRSWVAKWQRLDRYQEGVYATKVVGILPEEVLQDLEDRGIKYIPRDGTAEDDDT